MLRQLTPFIVISMFASGCAATTPIEKAPKEVAASKPITVEQEPQPAWIEGESKLYPRLDYMRSRAQADNAADAAKLAKVKLAKLFLVDINEFDMTMHQAKLAADYASFDTFNDAKSVFAGSPDVQAVIDEMKVVDEWLHVESGTHHAIAVLPRNPGRAYLRNEIHRLDGITEELIDQGQAHEDAFTQLGMMSKAVRVQQIRSALQNTMTRADLTGRGIKPKWRLNDIEKDIETLITSLRIYPTGRDEDMNARMMTAMLEGALKVADIKAAAENSADYILKANVDASIAGEENGWALGHGAVKVDLTDRTGKKLLGSTQWEFQTPGLDENHAKRRVLEKTEYMLKKNMRNILIDMAME